MRCHSQQGAPGVGKSGPRRRRELHVAPLFPPFGHAETLTGAATLRRKSPNAVYPCLFQTAAAQTQ